MLNLKICLKQPKRDSRKALLRYYSIIGNIDSIADFLKVAKWNPRLFKSIFSFFLFRSLIAQWYSPGAALKVSL